MMLSSSATTAFQDPVEDILALLPISPTEDYGKGTTIYGSAQPSRNIYLLVAGNVKLSLMRRDGSEALLEIVRPDELFGESAFLNLPDRRELAIVLENATLMAWPISAIEDLVMKRPRLAVALLQICAQRSLRFAEHIGSLAADNMRQRLAHSLIRLSARLGTKEENGTVSMMPMSHELLSQHIGTSREVVTGYMNQFRRQGYLDYTRKRIVLYPTAFTAGPMLRPLPRRCPPRESIGPRRALTEGGKRSVRVISGLDCPWFDRRVHRQQDGEQNRRRFSSRYRRRSHRRRCRRLAVSSVWGLRCKRSQRLQSYGCGRRVRGRALPLPRSL